MNENVKRLLISVTGFAILCLAVALLLSGCGTTAVAKDASAADAREPVSSAPTVILQETQEPEITVSASGTVRLTPDKAAVTFGVTTQEATADEAQRKNSEAVKNVISVLTERGIEEKSICTTGYSMYPQYEYSDDTGENRIKGYYVSTSMTVQDQDIASVGKLLSDCVAAGINNVDGVSFLCSGYDEAYSQALSQAVAAAREKAEALAEAAGKTLGDTVSVTEGWQDTSARYGKAAGIYVEEAAMDSVSPILQPGESEITASVTVTYRMN